MTEAEREEAKSNAYQVIEDAEERGDCALLADIANLASQALVNLTEEPNHG